MHANNLFKRNESKTLLLIYYVDLDSLLQLRFDVLGLINA